MNNSKKDLYSLIFQKNIFEFRFYPFFILGVWDPLRSAVGAGGGIPAHGRLYRSIDKDVDCTPRSKQLPLFGVVPCSDLTPIMTGENMFGVTLAWSAPGLSGAGLDCVC